MKFSSIAILFPFIFFGCLEEPAKEVSTEVSHNNQEAPLASQGDRFPAAESTRRRHYKRKGKRRRCRGRKCRRRRRGRKRRGSYSLPKSLYKKLGLEKDGGCSADLNMVYEDRGTFSNACYHSTSAGFRKALKTDFRDCIHQVSKDQGWPTISSIEVGHMGIFNPRKARGSAKWSTHATGRAIDLSSITLNFSSFQSLIPNKKINFTNTTKHPIFYNRLRKCWSEKNKCNKSIGYKEARIDNLPKGQVRNDSRRRYRKAYGKVMGLHDDHLHLSYGCPPMEGHSHSHNFKRATERYSFYLPK